MGKRKLKFKSTDDRESAIILLKNARRLIKAQECTTVCAGIEAATKYIMTVNAGAALKYRKIGNQLRARVMGSLGPYTFVHHWLLQNSNEFRIWHNDTRKQRPFNWSVGTTKEVREYRIRWLTDMIATLKAGGTL